MVTPLPPLLPSHHPTLGTLQLKSPINLSIQIPHRILRPARPLAERRLALDAARHEDAPAARGQHLFDDGVADVGRRVHFDAGAGELRFVRFHDPRRVPRWVHRCRLDAFAVRVPGSQLVAETCFARNTKSQYLGRVQATPEGGKNPQITYHH